MIPAEWTIEPLDKLVDYDSGRTPARANATYWEGADADVPWVAISDMENYGTISKTREMITRRAFDDVFRRKIVRAGTLLMSFKLTIGRVSTLGIDACHNEAIISIRPKAQVDQRYLGYFLSQVEYDDLQDRQIKGNTLNQDKIDRIPVVLPPKHEQCDIADVLDRVRQAITLETKATEVASSLKRAAMRALFTKGLRGEAQKETEIGLMPESWDASRLDLKAEVISTRMSYSELLESEDSLSSESAIVLGIKVADMNLSGNEVELINAELVRQIPLSIAQRRCAPPNTIVFPKRGAAIATNKKRISTTWTVFDPNVIGVIAGEGLDQRFLFQWFQSFDLRTITEPGPTPQLNKKNVEPLIIPVPPTIEEQCEIVVVLDVIDRKIDLHKRKCAVLEELFRSLLHKLMTGEIRVADLDLSALEALEPEGAAA